MFEKLLVGTTVSISDSEGEICEAVIRRRLLGKQPGVVVVLIEPVDMPGKTTEFAYFPSVQGWRMLFAGPDGGRCYRQSAPLYTLTPK